ncbi:MAG: nucleoside-diphosphate kinase [Patescibacteria group bacterium]
MDPQQALIIIKPDAVQRGLMGKILKRFEDVGLKIVAFKFEWADREKIIAHYPETDEWFGKVGQRTLKNYGAKGLEAKEMLGTDDPVAIGKMVKSWLIDYMSESPLLFAVVEGYETIHIVRKLCGDTNPMNALPGTIRGDFSHDNIDLANGRRRPLRNIIHGTDAVEEASKEINLWFRPEELHTYARADEEIMF